MTESQDPSSTSSRLEAGNVLPRGRRAAVTLGVMMGLFLAAIEQTVVATAMPTVVSSLGGLDIYSWVFSIYLLTFTVSVPVWGRLSDVHGRRNCYLISIGLFILGSALCGQAHSMAFLILFRAIQGIGGGGVFPIGFTVIGEIYSLQERARIQGLFSGVWGVASIVGPLVGGILTDLVSWRFVFYVNVPFGLLAGALIGTYLSEPARPRSSHSSPFQRVGRAAIDYRGVALFSTSVSALLLALIQAGKRGSFWEPDLMALVAISVALLFVFLRWERKADEPVLPVLLFRNPVFRACSVIGLLAGMGLFGSISFIPLFVQGVFFGSATQAGSALTPLMLGWTVLSIVSGPLLLRFSYRPLVIAGMASFAVGFLMLTRLAPDSAYLELLPSMGVLGVGMGLSMVTMLLAVQSTVPRKLLGIATSGQLFFRTIGGAIGVAIMGSVMGHRMTSRLDGTADPVLAQLAANPDSIVNEAARQALSAEEIAWLRDTLAASLHGVFVTGLVIALLAFALSLRFPRGSPEELARRLDPPPG